MKSRIDLCYYFNELGFKKGAEVGAAGGRFSEYLCQAIPGLELASIDIWKQMDDDDDKTTQEQQEKNYKDAVRRLSKYNVELLKGKSMEVVRFFKDNELDFVYIDASHSFDNTMEDIINWSRKVRSGGIVSGHDYSKFKQGVKVAVDTYVKVHNIKLNIIPMNKNNSLFNRDPSWWFVKP